MSYAKMVSLFFVGCVLLVGIYFIAQRNKITTSFMITPTTTIVAFGDSLISGVGATEGHDFVSELSDLMGNNIVNQGRSGDTSKGALDRIGDIEALNPDVVILLIGGNDALRQIPQEETFSNIQNIITVLKNKEVEVILLGIRGGLYGRDPYKDAFEDLAERNDLIYVPDVLDGLFGNSEYMSDPIHPNNIGYKKIADKVYSSIK